MINNMKQLSEKWNLNFIEAFFLNQSNVFFYIETQSHQPISETTFEIVYSKDPFSFRTLKDFINLLDVSSELCEIVGVNSLINSIYDQIDQLKEQAEVTLPINYQGQGCLLMIVLKRMQTSPLVLGQLKFVDSNHSEILYANSYKDVLTGLFNRNALKTHIRMLENENTFVSLIDIDHFKYVNDTFGHAQGDELLHQFGRLLIELSDKNMIAYRLGGDEFFLQLQGLNKEQVIQKISQINESIKTIDINGHHVSCSIGVMKLNKEILKNKDNVIWLADIALYKCKDNGKDGYYFLENGDIERCLSNKKGM